MSGHRSYSQLSSYTRCAKQFELTRIHHAPERPSWAQVGGKAFHSAIEYLNYGGEGWPQEIWEHFFYSEIDGTEIHSGFPWHDWKVGGRKSTANPDGENFDWWFKNGPVLLDAYLVWLAKMQQEGWQIAVLPDGRMGIETEYNVLLDQVMVKMFLDLVLTNGTDYLIVDAKTGQKPDGIAQLGIYKVGFEIAHGIAPSYGAYYMARAGELTPPEPLARFTRALYTKQFADLDKGIKAEIFLPNVGKNCSWCGVKNFCAAYGGTDQSYDPLFALNVTPSPIGV